MGCQAELRSALKAGIWYSSRFEAMIVTPASTGYTGCCFRKHYSVVLSHDCVRGSRQHARGWTWVVDHRIKHIWVVMITILRAASCTSRSSFSERVLRWLGFRLESRQPAVPPSSKDFVRSYLHLLGSSVLGMMADVVCAPVCIRLGSHGSWWCWMQCRNRALLSVITKLKVSFVFLERLEVEQKRLKVNTFVSPSAPLLRTLPINFCFSKVEITSISIERHLLGLCYQRLGQLRNQRKLPLQSLYLPTTEVSVVKVNSWPATRSTSLPPSSLIVRDLRAFSIKRIASCLPTLSITSRKFAIRVPCSAKSPWEVKTHNVHASIY